MELQGFIDNVANQYFDTPRESFSADTEFRNMAEWSSMVNLCILSMIKDEYDVFIDPNIVRQCNTIRELFEAVKSKVE